MKIIKYIFSSILILILVLFSIPFLYKLVLNLEGYYILDRDSQVEMIAQEIVTKGNPDLCLKIKHPLIAIPSASVEELINICFTDVASMTKDPQICEKVPFNLVTTGKKTCYHALAVELDDLNLCELSIDKTALDIFQYSCHVDVLTKRADFNECFKIPVIKSRDTCLLWHNNYYFHDHLSCKSIDSVELRDSCFNERN